MQAQASVSTLFPEAGSNLCRNSSMHLVYSDFNRSGGDTIPRVDSHLLHLCILWFVCLLYI